LAVASLRLGAYKTAMANPIFRQSALDTLSSPEQLNQLVKITSPRAWIALATVIAILGALLAWAFLGQLPSRMSGRGVLIHNGGTFNIVAAGGGVLTDFPEFVAGDKIAKGQLLGHIAKPALRQQIAAAEAYVARLKAEPTVDPIRLAQAAEALNRLRFNAELGSEIRSERQGVVVEAKAMDGDTVREGEPILSIEYAHTPLRAVLYLPPRGHAKLLRPGMTAEISPVTSRRERDGYLIGKVLSVAKYPSTQAGMMALINNADLVRELTPEGAPVAVEVELVPDPSSASGYSWSSEAGKPLDISSGTLCTGSFVVETRRPISLVFPMLDRSARR
jgi:hypothetical protein